MKAADEIFMRLRSETFKLETTKPNGSGCTKSAETEHLEPRPPAYTDDALALLFAEQVRDNLRFVNSWGEWLFYDGRRWVADRTLAYFNSARKICRTASATCNNPRISTVLASAKTVAAVISLARSDRRLAAATDQWDSDPLALNTPAGVVDLRTGKLRPHDHTDYFTKITAVAPSTEVPRRWHQFLARVTNDKTDLQYFLQRMAGYALTGLTREHALFFLHGIGANGKSVFINTISGILKEYHRSAPIEAFTAASVERHPTDLAALRGARLVTAVETEEGRRWAESKIKALTGGDKIAARFMRQDFFEYVPQFKLVIAGNYKPGLRSVDEAIRRRFHLVPFTVTIPKDERDDRLTQYLQAEWPGILQWAIDGCLAWQKHGLSPPEVVRAATADYLEGEDAISAWIDECCERSGFEPTEQLFSSWKAWTDRSGEYAGSRKRFREQLESRGFEQARPGNRRGFGGLRLTTIEKARLESEQRPKPSSLWRDA
jgi:putative DNA primase/helicase